MPGVFGGRVCRGLVCRCLSGSDPKTAVWGQTPIRAAGSDPDCGRGVRPPSETPSAVRQGPVHRPAAVQSSMTLAGPGDILPRPEFSSAVGPAPTLDRRTSLLQSNPCASPCACRPASVCSSSRAVLALLRPPLAAQRRRTLRPRRRRLQEIRRGPRRQEHNHPAVRLRRGRAPPLLIPFRVHTIAS